MTASSRRPFSQSGSCAGVTTSASWRLARLRHLPSSPSRSQTATSARPASFSAAPRFDPIKPAPPVTSNIRYPALIVGWQLCPSPARQATWVTGRGEDGGARFGDFTPPRGAVTDRIEEVGPNLKKMNTNSNHLAMEDPDEAGPILV